MKIDKAIEILSEKRLPANFFQFKPLKTAEDHDVLDAIMLGIEALKRHQECKDRTRKGMLMPLPGETVDKIII